MLWYGEGEAGGGRVFLVDVYMWWHLPSSTFQPPRSSSLFSSLPSAVLSGSLLVPPAVGVSRPFPKQKQTHCQVIDKGVGHHNPAFAVAVSASALPVLSFSPVNSMLSG